MNAFETLLLLAIQFSLGKVAASNYSFSCDGITKRSFVSCVPQDRGDVNSCVVHADEIREFRFIRYKKEAPVLYQHNILAYDTACKIFIIAPHPQSSCSAGLNFHKYIYSYQLPTCNRSRSTTNLWLYRLISLLHRRASIIKNSQMSRSIT